MLSKLPDSHVQKLRNLIEDNGDSDDDSTSMSGSSMASSAVKSDEELTTNQTKTPKKKRAKVRINENLTEIDNPAYETTSEEDEEKPAASSAWARRMSRISFADGNDDVEYNLQKEAHKLRRMSRMSLGSIKVVTQNTPKGVKFAEPGDKKNTVLNINDLEDLKVKIYNESKRRASIKPFKKPFGLEVSDSD